jgi:hypothetical protein
LIGDRFFSFDRIVRSGVAILIAALFATPARIPI